MLAICCDNADSAHAWAVGVGTLSFPVLSDFWPHGKVSEGYGVLNENGVPDRAFLLVNGEGRICYLDTSHPTEVPPIEPMVTACASAAG